MRAAQPPDQYAQPPLQPHQQQQKQQQHQQLLPQQEPRFDEPMKWLPVLFVCCNISLLYAVFLMLHCIPLLQLDVDAEFQDASARTRGLVQIWALHIITAMLILCYIRSIMTHPGGIPDNDREWLKSGDEPEPARALEQRTEQLKGGAQGGTKERKHTGERRYCKWCAKYKPDRCHHCRVCKSCILKMDHHCPWIYNCVGFKNHKYFFLLLFYSVLDCQMIMWCMLESVKTSVDVLTPFGTMFLLLFAETLAWFLGMLVTAFFAFHIWLTLKAMTTIEFCEKSLNTGKKADGYDGSRYNYRCLGNVKAVLGDNVFLWLLPVSPPSGDGLNYTSDRSPLMSKDSERNRQEL